VSLLFLEHSLIFSVKLISTRQAYPIDRYKNMKGKVLKCKASICCNKQCLNKIFQNYANIKMPEASPATKFTHSKLHLIRIKDEAKFLHKKKEKLNVDL